MLLELTDEKPQQWRQEVDLYDKQQKRTFPVMQKIISCA